LQTWCSLCIKKYSITQLVFFRCSSSSEQAAATERFYSIFNELLPCVCPVGSVDLCMDWEVRVSGGEDTVVGVRQNGGQGDKAGALWPVEHLRLKLGELVLEVWESLWQSFDNAGVNRVKHPLLGGTEVLGSLQC